MNLGWLAARDLSHSLHTIIIDSTPAHKIFPAFEKRREKALRNTVKRSELNMKLGRKLNYPALRNGIVFLMLNTPLSKYIAKLFTMRNIEDSFI